MKKHKQKAKPAIKCTGAIVNPDADNPMPMVCDRCGAAVEAFRHSLFDFQVWRDGRGRSPAACGGRLCPPCGDTVGRMLVYFGKSLGLTTNSTLPGLIPRPRKHASARHPSRDRMRAVSREAMRRRGPERDVTARAIRDEDGDWYLRLACGHRWYEIGGGAVKQPWRATRLCPICPDETYKRKQYQRLCAVARARHRRLFEATTGAMARAEGVLEELREREAAE